MGNLREILACNLKEYRRRCGFSQDKLAELADISSQYLATVETCRKFPTPEVLESLAEALDIEPHRLFEVSVSPENVLERLQEKVIGNIERVVRETIQETLAGEYKGKDLVTVTR